MSRTTAARFAGRRPSAIRWTGCPAGCPLGGPHECGVGEPVRYDYSLYDCRTQLALYTDGVRLTCASACVGRCRRRSVA